MTKHKQYIMLDLDLLNQGLNSNEVITMAIIRDRMKSSAKRGNQFFDKKVGAYYVILTHEELATRLGISVRTAHTIFSHLTNGKFISRKKQFNGADKLFLPVEDGPHYTQKHKLSRPYWKLSQPNHLTLSTSTFKSTTNTINTSVTADEGATEKVAQKSEGQAPEPTQAPEQPATPDTDSVIATLEFSNLTKSLTTRGGIPEDAAQLMASLAYNDHSRLHEIARVVYQAKAAVAKTAQRYLGSQGFEASRWETNNLMRDGFHEAVARIIPAAYKKNRDDWQGFAYTSFVAYFEELTNAWLQADKVA